MSAAERETPEWAMPVWELMARERIRETLVRYNHAGDSGRVEELGEQFAEDGQMILPGKELLVGRAAIVERLGGEVRRSLAEKAIAAGQTPMVRHHVSSVLIHSVTMTEAHAASYFLVMNRTTPDHWGRYRDVLVPVGSRWLILKREVRLDSPVPT
jgi:3-phenylpropionate/cinnamic acid dioxygenase small subunit